MTGAGVAVTVGLPAAPEAALPVAAAQAPRPDGLPTGPGTAERVALMEGDKTGTPGTMVAAAPVAVSAGQGVDTACGLSTAAASPVPSSVEAGAGTHVELTAGAGAAAPATSSAGAGASVPVATSVGGADEAPVTPSVGAAVAAVMPSAREGTATSVELSVGAGAVGRCTQSACDGTSALLTLSAGGAAEAPVTPSIATATQVKSSPGEGTATSAVMSAGEGAAGRAGQSAGEGAAGRVGQSAGQDCHAVPKMPSVGVATQVKSSAGGGIAMLAELSAGEGAAALVDQSARQVAAGPETPSAGSVAPALPPSGKRALMKRLARVGVPGAEKSWAARYDGSAAAAASARPMPSAPRRFPAAERGRLAPAGIDVGHGRGDFNGRSLSIADYAMGELRVLLGLCQKVTGQAALAAAFVRTGYAVRGSFNQGDVIDSLTTLIIEGREMKATVDNVYNLVFMMQRHLASRTQSGGSSSGSGTKKM